MRKTNLNSLINPVKEGVQFLHLEKCIWYLPSNSMLHPQGSQMIPYFVSCSYRPNKTSVCQDDKSTSVLAGRCDQIASLILLLCGSDRQRFINKYEDSCYLPCAHPLTLD